MRLTVFLSLTLTLGAASLAAPAMTGAATAAVAQATALAELLKTWDRDEHPDLRSVLVLRDGAIVAERYYNGENADTLRDVRSAGKSITSLLVGAALDRGHISKLSDPVQQYWPQTKGSGIGDVSIENLLTMRSGLASFDDDPDSPGNENKFDEAPDPQAFLLAVPRADAPGTLYRYNSLTAWSAGLVAEKAAGQDLEQLARSALFEPLGIARWQWVRDAAGHPKGQGNLSLRSRDLGKIGQMVLDQGQYQGRRVISAEWIAASLAPRVAIGAVDRYADSYGYFWYSKTQTVAGRQLTVHFASGNGGNKIYLIPERRSVVVITSSAYGKPYGQLRSENILKAVLAALDK